MSPVRYLSNKTRNMEKEKLHLNSKTVFTRWWQMPRQHCSCYLSFIGSSINICVLHTLALSLPVCTYVESYMLTLLHYSYLTTFRPHLHSRKYSLWIICANIPGVIWPACLHWREREHSWRSFAWIFAVVRAVIGRSHELFANKCN